MARQGGGAGVTEILLTAGCAGLAALTHRHRRTLPVLAALGYLIVAKATGWTNKAGYVELLVVSVLVAAAAAAAGASADRADADALAVQDAADAMASAATDAALRQLLAAGKRSNAVRTEIERSTRSHQPFAVLRIAVDEDPALAAIGVTEIASELVGRQTRAVDLPDLDELGAFTVVLPDTASAAARIAAERLRIAALAETVLTLSIGIAAYPHDGTTEASLIGAADAALAAARDAGGNRTLLASIEPGDPPGWGMARVP